MITPKPCVHILQFKYILNHHKTRRSIMDDSSSSYIHLVQHLIEKCLICKMSKEECMEALSKHAKIQHVITSTVWDELEKANKEFFEGYYKSQSNKEEDGASEVETRDMIHKMIADHDHDHDSE